MNSTVTNIVKSNLKQNKFKSILSIITIALTTCLLCSIGIITLNAFKLTKENIIKSYGNSHGYYKKLKENDIEKLKQHKDIELLGESSILLGKNEFNNTSFQLMYIDENALKMNNTNLIEGTLPKSENEIALDELIINKLGYYPELGKKIKVPYHDINKKFIEKEFILTGILERKEIEETSNFSIGIISKKFLKAENYNSLLRATVRIKDEKNLSSDEIRDKMKKIADDLGLNKDNIQFNSMYLLWMKPSSEMIIGGIAIALMVIVSSILVIYNIFYVSIISKTQDFGKLKAIGTTKKQIRSIIFKEGFILSVISIPLGIASGYFLGNLLIKKMVEITSESPTSISIPIILGSSILTLVTVYISLLKPMKIASKISPIEAIRYNGNNTNTKKKFRTGYTDITIPRLVKSNLSRNKKRTLVTILSLSLSGILIMTTSSIFSSINTKNYVREGIAGDFQFTIKYPGYDYKKEYEEILKNNPLNSQFIDDIKNIKGVKKVNELREVEAIIPNSGKYKEEKPNVKEITVDLGGYTDDMLKDLEKNSMVKEGKLNLQNIKNGNEIIANTFAQNWYGVNVGDIVKLSYFNDNEKIEKNTKVQAIVSGHYGGQLITSIDFIKNSNNVNHNSMVSIDINNGKYKEVSSSLQELSSNYKNLKLQSFKEEVSSTEKMFFSVNSMAYSLVSIMGIISLVNLFNTMITGILSRKKELGIFQSIGMTDKELLKMLKLESLFYTITTLISSLVLGSIIGYFGYLGFYNMGATYAVYKLPLIPAIILLASMILVQFIMVYIINKIFKKESLIDRVRYSE